MARWWRRRADDDDVDVTERLAAVFRQALDVAAVADEVRQAGRRPRPTSDHPDHTDHRAA